MQITSIEIQRQIKNSTKYNKLESLAEQKLARYKLCSLKQAKSTHSSSTWKASDICCIMQTDGKKKRMQSMIAKFSIQIPIVINLTENISNWKMCLFRRKV